MYNLAEQFGKNVKGLRKARGWTQSDLAKALSVRGTSYSRDQIASIETGRRDDIRLAELLSVSILFGFSIEELLGHLLCCPKCGGSGLVSVKPWQDAASDDYTPVDALTTVLPPDSRETES